MAHLWGHGCCVGGRERAGAYLPGVAGRPVCPLWGSHGWSWVTFLPSSRGALSLGRGNTGPREVGTEGPWMAHPQGHVLSQASRHLGVRPQAQSPLALLLLSAFLEEGRKAVKGSRPRSGDTQGPCWSPSVMLTHPVLWVATPGGTAGRKEHGVLDGHDPVTLSSRRSPWDRGPPSMSGLVGCPRQSQRSQDKGGPAGVWDGDPDTAAPTAWRAGRGTRAQSACDGERVPGHCHAGDKAPSTATA